MSAIQTIMGFVQRNIAYIMLVAAIAYFVFFVIGIVNARKNGERYHFRIRMFLGFLLVIIVAIYCLVTGTDLTTFIN